MDEQMVKDLLQNIDQIPSDMIARARKLANTRAGREMIKEMGQKGIDKDMIEKLMQEPVPSEQVLVIRPNGMYKLRLGDEKLLRATTPTSINKDTYTVWYDANNKTINKRASKWLGFNVGGMIVVTGDDLDKINFNL